MACAASWSRCGTMRPAMSDPYLSESRAPSRSDVDALAEPTLLDFGTDWCGHCRAAAPVVDAALAGYPSVRHLKVEDGPGRALGRSFGVKRWPTLVFLANGREVDRVVRPTDPVALNEALRKAFS